MSKKFYDGYHINEQGTVDFEELYERFGRELSTKLACNSGNIRCLGDTLVQNSVFIKGVKVPNGLQAVTFCNGFKMESGIAVWLEFWKLMQNTSDATFRAQVLSALGCTSDRTALKDYLESTLGSVNSVNYTTAERRNIFSAVLSSVNGLEVVINFLIDCQLDIMRTYDYTFENLLTIVARTVKDNERYSVFVEYLKTVLEELGSSAYNNIVAILNSNMNTQNAEPNKGHMEFIIEYLGEGGVTEVPSTTTTPAPPNEECGCNDEIDELRQVNQQQNQKIEELRLENQQQMDQKNREIQELQQSNEKLLSLASAFEERMIEVEMQLREIGSLP